MPICEVTECDRAASVGLLCKRCYNKKRLAAIDKICKIKDCKRKVVVIGKSLCLVHYDKERTDKSMHDARNQVFKEIRDK